MQVFFFFNPSHVCSSRLGLSLFPLCLGCMFDWRLASFSLVLVILACPWYKASSTRTRARSSSFSAVASFCSDYISSLFK